MATTDDGVCIVGAVGCCFDAHIIHTNELRTYVFVKICSTYSSNIWYLINNIRRFLTRNPFFKCGVLYIICVRLFLFLCMSIFWFMRVFVSVLRMCSLFYVYACFTPCVVVKKTVPKRYETPNASLWTFWLVLVYSVFLQKQL